jgi:hypothetical protein
MVRAQVPVMSDRNGTTRKGPRWDHHAVTTIMGMPILRRCPSPLGPSPEVVPDSASNPYYQLTP